jgi:D-xylose transport system permease protein
MPPIPPSIEESAEQGLVDETPPAAPQSAELVVDTFGEYLSAWGKRVRQGESGMLPVLAGFIAIIIIFQSQSSVFLSAANLTNLFTQAAVFVLLGMAEVFVLLLGEIDLSIGYVAGVGAVITCSYASTAHNFPWGIAVIMGLAATTAIGALQGVLITRLRLPSFIVTLGGLLFCEGLLIWLINHSGGGIGGTIRITNNVLNELVNGNITPLAGWIIMVAGVGAYAALALTRDRRRRSTGLAAPPLTLTLLKIGLMAIAGVVLEAICNTNRGRLVAVSGTPWVVLIILVVLIASTFVLTRLRFGRYIYAIGGNSEAARRAGINVNRVRLIAFTLSGLTAGAAGVVYASRLGSISNNVDGGTLVLYAVAAAVIGGTSLFGGRGKTLHAVIGGMVIATIVNGMGLLGLSAAAQYMITALVLLAAVTVDALARRGNAPA